MQITKPSLHDFDLIAENLGLTKPSEMLKTELSDQKEIEAQIMNIIGLSLRSLILHEKPESNHRMQCAEFNRLYHYMSGDPEGTLDKDERGYFILNHDSAKADFILKFCPFCGKAI